MLEKKTSIEINQGLYQSNIENYEYKVWVSEESLIKMLEEDKEFSNDIDMKNYIDDVINSLKGEKE